MSTSVPSLPRLFCNQRREGYWIRGALVFRFFNSLTQTRSTPITLWGYKPLRLVDFSICIVVPDIGAIVRVERYIHYVVARSHVRDPQRHRSNRFAAVRGHVTRTCFALTYFRRGTVERKAHVG